MTGCRGALSHTSAQVPLKSGASQSVPEDPATNHRWRPGVSAPQSAPRHHLNSEDLIERPSASQSTDMETGDQALCTKWPPRLLHDPKRVQIALNRLRPWVPDPVTTVHSSTFTLNKNVTKSCISGHLGLGDKHTST